MQRDAVADAHRWDPTNIQQSKRKRQNFELLGRVVTSNGIREYNRMYLEPSQCWIKRGTSILFSLGGGFEAGIVEKIQESDTTSIFVNKLTNVEGGGLLSSECTYVKQSSDLTEISLDQHEIFSILHVQPDFQNDGFYFISPLVRLL